MSDSVKFIFKTLIKVPIIITAAFGIFNIFAFCFIYFKMLGLSYVVMQTAVENNYLPKNELQSLYQYMQDDIGAIDMVESASIVVAKDDSGNLATMTSATDTSASSGFARDARTKKQYGSEVDVGVTCKYKILLPLIDGGEGKTADETYKSLEVTFPITIVYKVPGLKYYPDLG